MFQRPLRILAVASLLCGSGHAVLISAFQTEGLSADDEWVELHHEGAGTVDLSGWKLRYQSSSGTFSDRATFKGVRMPPGSFLLIAGSAYGGTPAADLQRGLSLSSLSTGFALQLLDARGAVVDLVACGTSSNLSSLGTRAPAPMGFTALVRKAWPGSDAASMSVGGRDWYFGKACNERNNATDFVIVSNHIPKNSLQDPEPVAAPQILATLGFTNSHGGWVELFGQRFLGRLEGVCRIEEATGAPLPILFSEPGAFWSNQKLRFRFPARMRADCPAFLVRHGPGGSVVRTALPSFSVAPHRITASMPVPERLQRGQITTLMGADFGISSEGMEILVDGVALDACEILSWNSASLSFYLPLGVLPGSRLTVKNTSTGVDATLEVAGLENAPPVLRGARWALSQYLAGPWTPVTCRYFRLDPEGDAPSNGYPRISWGSSDSLPLLLIQSNEFAADFVPARWLRAGETNVSFTLVDASVQGNTVAQSVILPSPSLTVDWVAPLAPALFRYEEGAAGGLFRWESGENDLALRFLVISNEGRWVGTHTLAPELCSFPSPPESPGSSPIALLRSQDRAGNLSAWSILNVPASFHPSVSSNQGTPSSHGRGLPLCLSFAPSSSTLRVLESGGRECWRSTGALRPGDFIPGSAFARSGWVLLVAEHPKEGRRVWPIWITP